MKLINKTVCILLSLVLLLGAFTACSPKQSDSPKVTDTTVPGQSVTTVDESSQTQTTTAAPIIETVKVTELSIAKELGFPVENLESKTVSGKEYAKILDRLVEYIAPEKLQEWQKLYPNFRNETNPIDRFNAMLALYLAAYHIGNGWEEVLYAPNGYTYSISQSWDEDYIDRRLFEGIRNEGYYLDGQHNYVDGAAYYYVLSRTSPLSGEFLFSYDPETNSMRVKDNCTYEEALLSAVRLICSQNPNACFGEPTFTATQQTELNKAAELGFPTENIKKRAITGAEFAELLDKYVETLAPERLAEWKEKYPLFRSDKTPLTRQTAMVALFLAGVHIENGYEKVITDLNGIAHSMSLEDDYIRISLFGGYESLPMYNIGAGGDAMTYPITMAALNYNVGRYSPYSGEYLFSADAATNTFLPESLCSYADALMAIVRVMCSGNPELLNTLSADIADASVLTAELLAKSQANPVVTASDHPVWHGMALSFDSNGTMDATVKNLNLVADWGFNSVRVMLDYRYLFSDYECTKANMFGLSQLDKLVAAAIERNLHLNLIFHFLPGREMEHDPTTFESTGDFDLFINPEKQEFAKRAEATIAKRYNGVSNYNLSISPFFEPDNRNFSSGLPYPEYTMQDTADLLGEIVDAIREQTPDRLIIYEAVSRNDIEGIVADAEPAQNVAKEKGNMIISYNFCQTPFVYANMTAEAGRHIDDDNHSIYCPTYPTKYYTASEFINEYSPMVLDGCLPAGTVIDIYLKSSPRGGEAYVTADGTEIFRESLESREYNVGYPMSGYIHYSESDKKIRFTLPADTNELKINMDEGDLVWCGMDIYLPLQYARDRWYFASNYDVFLGVEEQFGITLKHDARIIVSAGYAPENRITVNEDLTYTTSNLEAEASSETVKAWCEAISKFDGNCVIRFERADFSSPAWGDIKEYYADLLSAFNEYNFSWWSNDFWIMTEEYPNTYSIPEAPTEEYAGFKVFNKELLELLQEYQ